MTEPTCSVTEDDVSCPRPVAVRGWCKMHYDRVLRHGDAGGVEPYRRMRPHGMDPVDWFWAGYKRAENGCLEWQRGLHQTGYGACSTELHGGHQLAHRVAWVLTHGPIPDGMYVLHHCDNPPCGDVEHLFLGTHLSNIADMIAKSRHIVPKPAEGELNNLSKLTSAQVVSIRNEYAACNTSSSRLAKKYGVDKTNIRLIVNGKTWQSVGGPICGVDYPPPPLSLTRQ